MHKQMHNKYAHSASLTYQFYVSIMYYLDGKWAYRLAVISHPLIISAPHPGPGPALQLRYNLLHF